MQIQLYYMGYDQIIKKWLQSKEVQVIYKKCKRDQESRITIKLANNDKGLKDFGSLCGHFDFFIQKKLLMRFFVTCYWKYSYFPQYITFCVNICWITLNFFKVCAFVKNCIYFLKNDHNFKSFQNMIFLGFILLYHYLKKINVMYITPQLHMVKASWLLFFKPL